MDLNDKQTGHAGVTILDQDKQPYESLEALKVDQPGAALAFTSSDDTIAKVTVLPNGLDIDIASGRVGKAVITATPTSIVKRDGSPLPAATLDINVTNSKPDSLNFTPGQPTDE